MDCRFEIRDGVATCTQCRRSHPTQRTDPAQIRRGGCPGTPVEPAAKPERIPILPCIHRGPELGQRACRLCGQRDDVHALYACAVHPSGQATTYPWRRGQKEGVCALCPSCVDAAGRGYADLT